MMYTADELMKVVTQKSESVKAELARRTDEFIANWIMPKLLQMAESAIPYCDIKHQSIPHDIDENRVWETLKSLGFCLHGDKYTMRVWFKDPNKK